MLIIYSNIAELESNLPEADEIYFGKMGFNFSMKLIS
jgi:hypothetical protein